MHAHRTIDPSWQHVKTAITVSAPRLVHERGVMAQTGRWAVRHRTHGALACFPAASAGCAWRFCDTSHWHHSAACDAAGCGLGGRHKLPGLAITCQQPCSQRASFAFPTFACPSPCDVDAVIPGAMGQWRRALTGVPRDDVQSEARRRGEVQQQGRMRNVAQASGTGIRASGHQRLHPGTSSVSQPASCQPSLDRGGEPWAPASGCRSPGRGTECLSSALAGL